jgi:hypothetical protein
VAPAQPRALIGGHVVTTLAVLAMYVTGTFHPPASINPLLVAPTTCHGRFCSRR